MAGFFCTTELTRKLELIFGCCLPNAKRNLSCFSRLHLMKVLRDSRLMASSSFTYRKIKDAPKYSFNLSQPLVIAGRYQTMAVEHQHGGATEKEIFVSEDNKLMSVDVTTGNGFEVGIPKPLFDLTPFAIVSFGNVNFAPSLDGQKFLITRQREAAASLQYVVVQNWASEKK